MNIMLYKFNKRYNSTKRPSPADGSIALTGVYINDNNSSVTKFTLSVPDAKTTLEQTVPRHINRYNYAYIPDFGRYYWIYDWRYANNSIWHATLIVDVLASYRNCVLDSGSYGYCTRTDNPDLWNNYLIDNMYPTTTHVNISTRTIQTPLFSSDPNAGVFVLGIISTKPPKYGAMNYYLVPRAEMNILVSNMVSISPNDFDDAEDWKNSGLSSEVIKSIVSPMQYIKVCKWVPVAINYTVSPITQNEIHLGSWNSGAHGLLVDSANQEHTAAYYIRLIDIYNVAGDSSIEYINKPPFVEFELFNSLIGTIPLDPIVLSNIYQFCVDSDIERDPLTTQVAEIKFNVNLVNGVLRWEIRYKDEITIDNNNFDDIGGLYHDSKNIAVDLPLAEVSYNYIEQAKVGIKTAASAFEAGTLFTSPSTYITNITSGLLDTLKYTYKQDVGSVGAPNGSFFADIGHMEFIAKHTATTKHIPGMFGKPANNAVELHALENYYASLDKVTFGTVLNEAGGAMLKSEYDELIDRLREGVFLQ